MELRQLRYFATVAEEGSFSRAAQVLYVAQSALSYQVAALERELGAKLFHRLPRGVSLTEAGHVFLVHAIAVLRQAEEAKASVSGVIGEIRGQVNLGLPPSICNALAVPLIEAVRSRLPGVQLELTEAASGDLNHHLKSGLVHISVLFDDGDNNDFLVTPLVQERLFLIAKSTPENRKFGDAVDLKFALQLPLFLASPKQGVRRIVEQAARDNGLPRPNVISEVNSVSIMRSTLLAGLGYTLLPPMPFKAEFDLGLLKSWAIRSPELHRRVVIATLKGAPLTAATRAVYELVQDVALELCEANKWPEARPAIETRSKRETKRHAQQDE